MMVLSKWLFPRLWEGFHVDLPALRIAIIAAFLALDLPKCSQVTSASSPSIVKVLPLQVDHDKLNYKMDAEPILLMSGRSTRYCCFLHLRGPSQVHNFATGCHRYGTIHEVQKTELLVVVLRPSMSFPSKEASPATLQASCTTGCTSAKTSSWEACAAGALNPNAKRKKT